ncbi:MAG: DUF4124 domain-containing protein [Methylococcales bacterium]|nr:DUF4124 domain-containing protein [Methylococcales bacterium]
MKLTSLLFVLLIPFLFSSSLFAAVFKCTDSSGNTSYQASPCAKTKKAIEINIKTGSSTDLIVKQEQEQKQQELDLKVRKQEDIDAQLKLELIAKRKKDTLEQSAINQQLIKDNSIQFSAFAIPPYNPDSLPHLVKQHEARLAEIEKFRRLAAQKALSTGDCIRVEGDDLNVKSKPDLLVFSVSCSSSKTFTYNETELSK